jgi:four helix bundle protein
VADFKKLLVWQKAHALALEAHGVAKKIRGAEHMSLRSQLVRSAMSIPANIVEGRGQESPKEFARYLRIAVNSASELEYHLIAGRDIGCISKADFLSLLSQLIEVRKMLYGLLNHLRAGTAWASRR